MRAIAAAGCVMLGWALVACGDGGPAGWATVADAGAADVGGADASAGGVWTADATVSPDAPAVSEAAVEAGDETGTDAASDAGSDVGAAADVGVDARPDAGDDAAVDAPADVGVDAGIDAGFDAGEDAGIDAGEDAPVDAPADACFNGSSSKCCHYEAGRFVLTNTTAFDTTTGLTWMRAPCNGLCGPGVSTCPVGFSFATMAQMDGLLIGIPVNGYAVCTPSIDVAVFGEIFDTVSLDVRCADGCMSLLWGTNNPSCQGENVQNPHLSFCVQ